jgi:hypothetical protein
MSTTGGKSDAMDPILPDGEGHGSEDASAAALRMDLLGASAVESGADAPPRSKLSGQAALLLMVVVAGVGGLLSMRYLGMGPRSSQGEVPQVEYDFNKVTSSADHNRVLEDLSANRAAEQVPPDFVQRNPFQFAGALDTDKPLPPSPNPTTSQDKDEIARARAEMERRQTIDRAFASLDLHTVLAGSNPVARISGQTVRVGDRIGEFFTVVEIQGRSVSLDCEGKTFVLSLAEDSASGARPRK